jgi:hypothetical protein
MILSIEIGVLVSVIYYRISQIERGKIKNELTDLVLSLFVGVCGFLFSTLFI